MNCACCRSGTLSALQRYKYKLATVGVLRTPRRLLNLIVTLVLVSLIVRIIATMQYPDLHVSFATRCNACSNVSSPHSSQRQSCQLTAHEACIRPSLPFIIYRIVRPCWPGFALTNNAVVVTVNAPERCKQHFVAKDELLRHKNTTDCTDVATGKVQ